MATARFLRMGLCRPLASRLHQPTSARFIALDSLPTETSGERVEQPPIRRVKTLQSRTHPEPREHLPQKKLPQKKLPQKKQPSFRAELDIIQDYARTGKDFTALQAAFPNHSAEAVIQFVYDSDFRATRRYLAKARNHTVNPEPETNEPESPRSHLLGGEKLRILGANGPQGYLTTIRDYVRRQLSFADLQTALPTLVVGKILRGIYYLDDVARTQLAGPTDDSRPWTAEDDKVLIGMSLASELHIEISDRLNRGVLPIQKRWRQVRISAGPRFQYTAEKERMRELMRQGKSIEEIHADAAPDRPIRETFTYLYQRKKDGLLFNTPIVNWGTKYLGHKADLAWNSEPSEFFENVWQTIRRDNLYRAAAMAENED